MENKAYENKENYADKYKKYHKRMKASVGMNTKVKAEQTHSDKSTEYSSEKTISAIQPWVSEVASRAEHYSDTGEGWVSVKYEV